MSAEESGDVRFRVLGATELVAGGAATVIGSERQRRLLSALVVGVPDTVSVGRLAEAVWGDAQPDSPVNALRTVVTRLRHSLDGVEAGSGRRIVSRPPGYVLDVPGDAIDANRFADLAVAGRHCLAEGDLDTARRLLAEALRMWRGPPYAEFGHEDWAHGEAIRLERLWVATREADIETRLAAGLQADLLGDVQQLIDDEPLSDRPRALLMRTLYARGSQADSLRAFQDYRGTLGEETGLEPGPELVHLEQRILANDPALLPPPGRPLRGYRLHERIATTERGAVFRATQPGLERDVALEVIREEIIGDARFVRTFELQGQALARLGHAHVAPIYDCWREPEGAYLVHRLLSGGSLADPEVRDRLGPEGLARVRAQVRSALDVAHQSGLVHGPTEPGDVQFDDHDTAYLANFRLGAAHATVEEDDRSFDRLFDALVGPTLGSAGPVAPVRVGNPYRGLAAFSEPDVDVFFGRARVVEATLEVLREHGTAFVVGPSGSGKSSLVHAGVLPALAAGELIGSEDWFVVDMVPGADPFAQLEAAVVPVAAHPTGALAAQLRDDGRSLAETIQQVLPEPDATAVLVVDQFEELFTATPVDERDRFLALLGEAIGDPGASLKVIATLRADFYDEPLGRPVIAPVVTRSTVPCDALSGDELRAAIVEPAQVAGVDVEPELVGRLVADASGRIGTLPLLQYALTQLFESRHGDILTLDSYLAMGALTAAVGARAEELHDALDGPRKQTCRRLFGRLVTVDASGATRRRALLGELRSAEPDPGDLDTVADRFVDARLLLADRDPASREPTLEVAHESLFEEWTRLAAWIRDDRDTIATLRHLTATAKVWRAKGDDSDLYRGARLAGALDLAAEHGDRLTPREHAFVDASQGLAEAEQRRQRRTNRRLRSLLVAVGALLAVALVAGFVADQQRRRGDERADDAERAASAEAAARADADLERLTALAESSGAVPAEVAILVGLEAHRINPSPETLTALHWALTNDPRYQGSMGTTRIGGDITVLDDGVRIVTHSRDTIDVWDVATRQRLQSWPFPGSDDVTNHRVLRSTAAADGSFLVATAPAVTTLIATDTGEELAHISHPTSAAGSALSPDDDRLALAFEDGTVQIRDVATPERVTIESRRDAAVTRLAWHPDGERLALGSVDGDVAMWNPRHDDLDWQLDGSTAVSNLDPAPALLFSGEGDRLVVTGHFDPTQPTADYLPAEILILDPQTGRGIGGVPTGTANDTVRSLSWFDTDETIVLTSGQGRLVQTFELETGEVDLPGAIGNFEASAVLPELGLIVSESGLGLDVHSIDGSNALVRRLASPAGGATGTHVPSLDPTGAQLLVTWSPPDPGAATVDLTAADADWKPYRTGDGQVSPVVLGGPEGLWVATGAGMGIVDWNGLPLGPHSDLPVTGIRGLDLSAGADRYYVSAGDGDHLYDTTSGEQIAALDAPEGPEICCPLPRFSTDGELFSRSDRAGGTELYDAATGGRLAFPHPLDAALFGPRDTWFLAVDDRGSMQLHDQQSGDPTGPPMVGHRGPIQWFRAHPATNRLATSGFDNTARIWDLDTSTPVGRPIDAIVFRWGNWSADGRFFAVPTPDGIEVWDFDTERWPELACELAGRNLTHAEWERYGPRTSEHRATCPRYPL